MPFIWSSEGVLFVPTSTYQEALSSNSGLSLLFDDESDEILLGNNTTQISENLITPSSLLAFARQNLILQEPVVAQTIQSDLHVEGGLFASSVHVLSDARFKKDVTPVESKNSLSIVNRVKTYTYFLKDAKTVSHGVLAQELREIAPETVREEGGVYAVDHNQLVALLIGSVRELSRRVEELEKLQCCEK